MSQQKRYQVTYQQPFIYIDNGVPVNGFLVRATLLDWNEPAEINVPKLDAVLINEKLMSLVRNRQMLADLGGDTDSKK